MQVEIYFAVAGTGADLLATAFRNNRGRLRRQGVHFADAACPVLLRRHQAVIAGTEDKGLKDANALAQAELAQKGVRRLVFIHEYGVPANVAAREGKAAALARDMQQALVRILAGFDHAKTTVHLCSESSQDLAVRLWLASGDEVTSPASLQSFAAYCGEIEVGNDYMVASIVNAFPTIACVPRDGDLREVSPKEFVVRFFRDIGVRRSSLKLAIEDEPQFPTADQCRRIIHLSEMQSGPNQSSGFEEGFAEIRRETPAARKDAGLSAGMAEVPADADERNRGSRAAPYPLTIFFMVEPGPLELQAHLLIASLEVNCRDNFRLVAFCRDDRVDDLNPATKEFLAATQTELRTLTNTFADGYPAGNKLIAASLVNAAGWSLFMDTDMLLVRPTSFMSQAAGRRISLCVDTVNGWTNSDAQWEALAHNLDMASLGPKIVLRGGATSYPLYNAGLVMFPPVGQGETDFGHVWYETALRLDRDEAIENKRPWLDTIALAACVLRDQSARPISEDWNCTTRNATASTRVLHYHGLRQLRQFDWENRASAILAASSSPYDNLNDAVTGHREDMGVKGDLWRRAMRHGHLNG